MRTLVDKGVIVDIIDYTILRTYINSTTNTFDAILSMNTICFLPQVGMCIEITPDVRDTMKRTSTGDIYQLHTVLIFVRKGAMTSTIQLEHVSVKSIKVYDTSTSSCSNAFQYRCIGTYV